MSSQRRGEWGQRVLRASVALAVLCLLWPAAAPRAQETTDDARIESAVVSIEVTQQHADWYSPWQGTRPDTVEGSGFLIGAGRIMTNAHVVSDARQIVVHLSGDNRPYFADIDFIGHDTDLATLRVEDPNFARGIKPLELGGIPSLRSRVRTYGYPAGGDKISRTEGVVSRVQFITYLHTGADSHLAVQTDSAINPGNSGGPVIQDGKVIGVAFQTATQLSSVGYFIPTPVIRRFLADIKDGNYDGYGDLGVITSNLINPTYRQYLGLTGQRLGIVVDQVLPGSSSDSLVHPDDVILAVDGVPVYSDSTIDYHGYSLSYQQVVEEKQIGDRVHLSIWRDKHKQEIDLPLKAYPGANRMREQFDEEPPYFIYAGLVFMRLNREYLDTFGDFWANADKHLLYEQFYAYLESDKPFPGAVVLGRVLPSRINSAYTGMVNSIVKSLNGVPIHTLRDLQKGLAAARGGRHVFVLEPGDLLLVLNQAKADRASPRILKLYGIDKDRNLP